MHMAAHALACSPLSNGQAQGWPLAVEGIRLSTAGSMRLWNNDTSLYFLFLGKRSRDVIQASVTTTDFPSYFIFRLSLAFLRRFSILPIPYQTKCFSPVSPPHSYCSQPRLVPCHGPERRPHLTHQTAISASLLSCSHKVLFQRLLVKSSSM